MKINNPVSGDSIQKNPFNVLRCAKDLEKTKNTRRAFRASRTSRVRKDFIELFAPASHKTFKYMSKTCNNKTFDY